MPIAAEGVDVVQATHDLHAALDADHCLLLQEGRLIEEGKPGDVLTDSTLRQVWDFPEAP